MYRTLFPSAPFGKTILDVGCHTGFYCFMAASEGAKHCLGIDSVASRINKGKELIARLGITNIELEPADVFEFQSEHCFDFVLCLNLLHHMQTLERAETLLEKVYGWGKEAIVFIVILPRDPASAYEYIIENNARYIHFSAQYFRAKYGAGCVREIPLDPRWYGANRSIVILNKVG